MNQNERNQDSMDKSFQNMINASEYHNLYDFHTARILNMIDIYAGDNADMLKSYYLARTKDGRRIIDAMQTDEYIDSIGKRIARTALKSIDKVHKEVFK